MTAIIDDYAAIGVALLDRGRARKHRPSADEITTLARRMRRTVLMPRDFRMSGLAGALTWMGHTVLTLDQADPLPGDPA